MVMYKKLNGVTVEVSAEEEKQILADREQSRLERPNNLLREIRMLRNQKLEETDWKVTSAKEQGTNLSTSFKNWRQGLRDIPTTYTTESEYDELLARDDDGNLTHSVWSE
jgi:hypothetical protein|tara:strand:+ start:595 stop:924 length:330 start_codon:yes stop_codon:yes gene_type:complete